MITDDNPWAKESQSLSAMADIEVAMVENHANMRIRSKSRPRQLVKLVHELQILRLTILHLSVTSLDQIVLYSLSVKVSYSLLVSHKTLTSFLYLSTLRHSVKGAITEL